MAATPRRLTYDAKRDQSPAWSPDGRRIAFASNGDIYVMDADGGNQRRLTTGGVNDGVPSWSPDGCRIAFASERTKILGIYVMNIDGSETPVPEPEMPTDPVAGGSTGEVQTFSLPGGASMEFVWIEPGVFWMGSPDTEAGRYDDEGPLHEVEISRGFWLGKFEVTQGQWEAGTGDTRTSYYQGDARRPVDSVSWDDVQRFIDRLNDAAGDSLYRLPTEAEWEYACRAGSSTRWSFGDDEGNLSSGPRGAYIRLRPRPSGRPLRPTPYECAVGVSPPLLA